MADYTPGPWHVAQGAHKWDFIVAEPTGNTICEPNTEADFSDLDPSIHSIGLAESKANARLIASAPDLLASCKELVVAVAAAMRVVADLDALHLMGASAETRQQRLVDELHASGVVDGFGVRATAIIAKAEGR